MVAIANDGTVTQVEFPAGESTAGHRMRSRTAYRTCSGRNPAHYLPADYGDQDVQRITVGIIGNTAAGKSHLLAAMIGQFMRGAIRLQSKFGLLIEPLDMRIHAGYMSDTVQPFLDRKTVLKRTERGVADITDAFLVTNMRSGARFAIIFIDVAGELLASAGPEGKEFLGAVNALMFLVDPQAVRGLALRPAEPDQDNAGTVGDPSFDVALRLLRLAAGDRASAFLRVPSATVVAKSDLLTWRGHPIVDRWMRAEASDDLDLGTVEEESEDVFTYLYARGAERWLEAAQQTAWSTLHFASAAGTAPKDDTFPEVSFQPRRVIKPLLSLLAAKGVIDPGELFGALT